MTGISKPTKQVAGDMGMILMELSHNPDLRFAMYGGFILFDATGARDGDMSCVRELANHLQVHTKAARHAPQAKA
eukprot:5617771-Prymnesium_polylepis.1